MADIINSVDRSLDMCIYDLYIYRYISLSIYRSIFLYLFWLADIFASVERPDNKSLHLADMILIKAFKFIAWCKAAPHNLRLSSFFALAAHGRKVRKPAVPGSTPGKKKTVSPLYSMSVLLFGFLWNQVCRFNHKERLHPTCLFIIMITIIKSTIVRAL